MLTLRLLVFAVFLFSPGIMKPGMYLIETDQGDASEKMMGNDGAQNINDGMVCTASLIAVLRG